ncbi:helix-turn-helix domain-containing protein [Actinoplanes sp. TFC3]|uniref:AfsR/SARP family transcriptional regulator n=1 Tax=Actinoplanes sp. TFC3 TaxID=1710355 RepID=UPI000831362A|nr:helix-turn-helix domain-containing protein [Actinoplanes sp. TFC3]
MYEIQLFGRLEVRTRGVRLTGSDLGDAHAQQILALLALRGHLRTSELADLLWTGNAPAAAETIVERHMSLLRQHLEHGTPVIEERDGGYALIADRVRVDVTRFDQLAAAASGRSSAGALRPLTAAAHLAARPLLEDVDKSAWAARARALYRVRLMAILLEARDHALATGDTSLAFLLANRVAELDSEAVEPDPAPMEYAA